jgi:hypothetical protein
MLSRRDFLRNVAMGAVAAAVVPSWAADEPAPTEELAGFAGPLPRRGIHVMAGGASSVPALERLVGEIAPSLGLNWVILEVDAGFQFASHPECAESDPVTKEDARKLAALARDKDIQLVPQYQCLGHQSWRENTGALLRAHPEFNEAPEMDATAEGFYCMSWCPNHSDLNAIVFDLFDELIDAFEAKAFHVGMDEVFILGQCPRCKGKSNAELFAKAVNDLHGHLVGERGVEMQMWGDRLLNEEVMHYDGWDNSNNGTWEAVDSVPKDIVMCDWHYGMSNPGFPSVRFFQDKGFRVWPSGWNSERSIRRFIEVARKESGPLMLGYLCTTWTDVTPLVKGLAGEPVESEERHLGRVVSGVKLGAQLARGEDA